MPMPVYFDYLSTTPVDPAVAEAMTGCLTMQGTFGNPASRSHRFGWEAEMAVETARQQVASLINADLREIAWTSGATESDNLALKGVVEAVRTAGNTAPHIVTSAIEHKAVLDTCKHLETQGVAVTYLQPDEHGLIQPAAVGEALQSNSCLVSVMHANNEIGTINNIRGIAAVCRSAGVPLHVDAAQTVGKIPLDVQALDIDLLSMSAHKFYGPKGIGALYQRRSPKVPVSAQMHGGGHERGLRAGTLPTHQIVGMGAAAAIAEAALEPEGARLMALREQLWSLVSDIDGLSMNGHLDQRLPGALNISVSDVEGEALLLSLPEFALSTGSACTSASMEPSYVLRALGLSDALAHSSLRVSLGRFTEQSDVLLFSERLHEVIPRLRRDAA
ncbi:cysteine desulfurase [gamma proteobacterium NOR5-3]|nr:cysteine desulfurase [gamma proteobacterium NOR5-3]